MQAQRGRLQPGMSMLSTSCETILIITYKDNQGKLFASNHRFFAVYFRRIQGTRAGTSFGETAVQHDDPCYVVEEANMDDAMFWQDYALDDFMVYYRCKHSDNEERT